MSSHEIVVPAARVERLAVARPTNRDRDFWEGIEEDANGRHALILGSLDDALIMPGTLAELAAVAGKITEHVTFEQARVARKAAKRVAAVTKEALMREFTAELPDGTRLRATGPEMAALGDQLSARFASERSVSVTRAARMMSSASEDNAWCGFGCGEVDGIAAMLALHGHLTEAGDIIAAHAVDDDCGDPHGYIGALGEWEARQEAAEVYVRRNMLDETEAQPVDVDEKRRLLEAAEGAVRQLRQEVGLPVEL
jgi:hypothetical protein